MKNIITICMLSIAAIGYTQEKQPTFKAEGDLVKATYYYEDGSVKTEGYFKDKKITGEWIRFDKDGTKTEIAFYNIGKKVGKWFIWSKDSLKEINYENNSIASVKDWRAETSVAYGNE
jgi:antitoxin component YwqK of YwqJK toxin-antitoxin module